MRPKLLTLNLSQVPVLPFPSRIDFTQACPVLSMPTNESTIGWHVLCPNGVGILSFQMPTQPRLVLKFLRVLPALLTALSNSPALKSLCSMPESSASCRLCPAASGIGQKPDCLPCKQRQTCQQNEGVCSSTRPVSYRMLVDTPEPSFSPTSPPPWRRDIMPSSSSTAPDGTGRTTSRSPPTSRCCTLPPYSPELNPMENVFAFLKSNDLANQIFKTATTSAQPSPKPGRGSSKTPSRLVSIDQARMGNMHRFKTSRNNQSNRSRFIGAGMRRERTEEVPNSQSRFFVSIWQKFMTT